MIHTIVFHYIRGGVFASLARAGAAQALDAEGRQRGRKVFYRPTCAPLCKPPASACALSGVYNIFNEYYTRFLTSSVPWRMHLVMVNKSRDTVQWHRSSSVILDIEISEYLIRYSTSNSKNTVYIRFIFSNPSIRQNR